MNGNQDKVYKKFTKVKHDEDSDYEDDINMIFAEDRDKFIGEFETDDYIVIRGYLDGQSKCVRLYYTKFEPKEQKVASLCIIHGFGEYSGRFLQIAEAFVKNGFVVHLIDLRGFGYSGGPRGTATVEKMHQDIGTMFKQVHKDLPLFLYAHSLGGLLALSIVQRNPHIKFAGVVATSSLLSMPKDRANRNLKNFIVRLIGDKLEDVVVNSLVNVTALSKVNYEIKKNFTDRLMIPFLGMNMAKSIIEATLYCLPNAETFPAPVFLIHGQLDAVTDYKDSVEFIQRCRQPNKRLHIFEDGYHELQHDKEREQLKEMAVQWCKEQLLNAQPVGIINYINYGVIVEPIISGKKLFLFGSILALLFLIFVKKSFKNQPNLSKYIVYLFGPMILIKYIKKRRENKKKQQQEQQQQQ